MPLTSLSVILVGGLTGTLCASITPSYFVVEASLAVGVHLVIIFYWFLRRREIMGDCMSKEPSVAASENTIDNTTVISSTSRKVIGLDLSHKTAETLSSDRAETLSNSTTGSDPEENKAGPSSPHVMAVDSSPEWLDGVRFETLSHVAKDCKPTDQSTQERDVLGALPPKSKAVARPKKEPLRQLYQDNPRPRINYAPVRVRKRSPSKDGTPTKENTKELSDLPIHERVEEEKKRLSFSDLDLDDQVPKATSHSLRFQDTDGRRIRFTLRPSKKKSCATYLEVTVGDEAPRKVRNLVYDNACCSIRDKKMSISISSSYAFTIMRSLKLLSKISMVKLDYLNGSPVDPSPAGMRKVQSSVDFARSTNMPRVAFSTNSLSDLPRQ